MKSSIKNNTLKASIVLMFFSFGCNDAFEDDVKMQSQSFDIAVAGAWTPSASSLEASASYHPEYHGAPNWTGSCPNTFFTDEAKKLKAHLASRFPGEISEIQGYSCRSNTANRSKMSVHGTGRALDLMIPTVDGKVGGPADNTAGDRVANYLVENAEELGVQLIIWDRWQFSPYRSARSRAYPRGDDHNNHIHVEVLPAMACTGNIEISMEWTAKTDLDLHVIPPGGREISPDIGDRSSSAGGRLERDSCYKAVCYENEMDHREVVAWKNVSVPDGTYRVWAENFTGSTEAQFEMKFVYPNGDLRTFPGTISATKGGSSEIFEFELRANDVECPRGGGGQGTQGKGTNGGGQNGNVGRITGDIEPPPLVNAKVGGCSTGNSLGAHPLLFLLVGLFGLGRRKKKTVKA